jgi:hypothetical protein
MLRSARQLQIENRAFVACPLDLGTIRRLLEASERKKADALREANSADTRVEAFYDACFNIALAVLNASRWKAVSIEGHHAFTLEAACEAIGATEATFDRADAVRELRNQKYAGVERSNKDVQVARAMFEEIQGLAEHWFRQHL